jgi:hypothetical protein
MPGAPAPSLVDRAKNIIMSPKTEWPRIDAEPATIGGIYTSYVMILAAIGPIAMLIGQQLVGINMLGISYKPSIGYSIGSAVLTYLLSLVSVYVMALIIDALAPSFGGTKDQVKAFKVAAYASTAAWLAGIFQIIPMLAFLGLLGLYSLYLLYVGLPLLMKVPADKAVGYTVVVIVVYIVVYFVALMIVGALVSSFFSLGALTGGTIRY